MAQTFGQGGKALRGGFGDVAVGLPGLEALGRQPDAAQQGQVGWLVHLGNAHFVRGTGVAGELGVDANGETVRHHQNRRVGQGQAVGEQLLERGVEVFARRLVLPRKHAAHEDVGIARLAADDGALFFKPVALGAARLGHAEQFAQVQKVALRALLFVEGVGGAGHATGRAPFGDEILGGHGIGL
ncbi:hypothetical protein KI609_16620 [Acidovorax radicis]|nr:hypothetical protein [Acidovorax radicis]UCU98136.1 hypothetical protein KI609_16620 [Acidovorax radicis]